MFPGYLFARFHWLTALREVRHARGVRGVVHFGERWPTMDAAIIADLRRAVGDAGLCVISAQLAPGDAVKIASGNFQGLQAVVTRVMPNRERVAVLMEFLGRQTSLELPAAAVLKPGGERSTILQEGV